MERRRVAIIVIFLLGTLGQLGRRTIPPRSRQSHVVIQMEISETATLIVRCNPSVIAPGTSQLVRYSTRGSREVRASSAFSDSNQLGDPPARYIFTAFVSPLASSNSIRAVRYTAK